MVKKDKKPIFKDWRFWVAVVIVLAIIGAIGGTSGQNNTETNTNTDNNTSEVKKDNSDPSLFEELEMEELCQEDYATDIKGYFNSIGVDYELIYTTNYNKYFEAKYQKTFDDAERPVALLSWNGKNKDTGAVISFMCWATKVDGQKKLLLLQADEQTIRGNVKDVFHE